MIKFETNWSPDWILQQQTFGFFDNSKRIADVFKSSDDDTYILDDGTEVPLWSC